MGKPNILVFFQSQELCRQYDELFPYNKLSHQINIKKFICSNYRADHHYSLRLSAVSRKINSFLHFCRLKHAKCPSLLYKNLVSNKLNSRYHKKLFEIKSVRKSHLFEQFLFLMFANLAGIFILKKILEALFYYENVNNAKILNRFNLFIVPYTGAISVEQDYLIWFGRKNQINTIAIQENWDNLSSKQILLYHPNIFLVWGNQSGSHLRTFHNFQGQIVEGGCLRLCELYNLRSEHKFSTTVSQDKDKIQILYVDSGLGSGDLQVLRFISDYLSKTPLFRDKYRIIYRTHPKMIVDQAREQFLNEIKSLPGIELFHINDETNSSRLKQINDSKIIISIFSTYILEASILNKICIIPTFGVGIHYFELKKLIDDIQHFHGMSLMNRVFITDSTKEINLRITQCLNSFHTDLNDPKLLDWFCKNIDTKSVICDLVIKNSLL